MLLRKNQEKGYISSTEIRDRYSYTQFVSTMQGLHQHVHIDFMYHLFQ